jgi:amino acid adenylation domain-containing protein/thioester reductase-like protein
MFRQYLAHNSLLPFYISWQLRPNAGSYNLCFSYQLKSDEEVELLIERLQELIKLKANLRQTFTIEEEKLIAYIHDDLPAEINFLMSSSSELTQLEEKLIKEAHNINTNSSIRLNIIKLTDSDSKIALFNIHHILMDGASLDNFLNDLNGLLKKKSVIEENANDYISNIMQETNVAQIESNELLDSYVNQLTSIINQMNFSSIKNKDKNYHYTDTIPNSIYNKLKDFSQKHSISIFNLLLIAQGIFLCKLFNQDIGLIRYPINIRENKEIDGCFINLVTLPTELKEEDTYFSIISKLKNKFLLFKSISKMRLNSIENIESIPTFAASNFAQPKPLIIPGTDYEAKTYPQIADSVLSIKYRGYKETLAFSCDVSTEIFPEPLSRSLLARFFHYLNKLIDDPGIPLITTDLLFAEERHKILHEFNNTTRFYPRNKTIHQLFEEQVGRTPNGTALVLEGFEITYSELNKRANQLAYYLTDRCQVKSNDLVALCLERSLHLIIAMLAVLKTGSAYVALGCNFQNERTKYILKDTEVKIVLTSTQLKDKLSQLIKSIKNIEIITLNSLDTTAQLDREKTTNINTEASSNSLAHLIYTSGTTGSPKGVMIEHNNVVSLVKNVNYFHADEFDTFALFSDTTFDASTFEIWGALLNGSRLFIPSDRLRLLGDAEKLKKTLDKHHITILWLTKTLFDQLFYLDELIFNNLNYLLIGGEALNKTLVHRLAASQHKPANIINGYGPTENTTFSCTYRIILDKIKHLTNIPIGSPLSNRVAYVLDSHLNLLPVGAVGELYVGGAGLSRGYLNKKELTEQKFIINPFQTKKEIQNGIYVHNRLYKTGDQARILPDGNLEYLGRNDFQIKIRGYRVEPGEIENLLMRYPEIKQVAVLYMNPTIRKDAFLIAYYTANTELKEIKLRNFLTKHLPLYMLPKAFVYLPDFPKTISGKLDIKSLPLPKRLEDTYLEPKSEEEKLICAAFSKVLAVEKIGLKDDFFLIGGDSLKAVTLVAILQINFKITISDIFEQKTPENIARNIKFSKGVLKAKLEKIKLFYHEKRDKVNTLNSQKVCLDHHPLNFKRSRFQVKPINNILLTGATGYLGCNIINQILNSTNYTLFLLVRATSVERAFHRVNKRFHFYFDKGLENAFGTRLFVFPSDIEEENLQLSEESYQMLASKIDSIVHTAALTKHYGEYDQFYSANVQATVNLLEFSKLTKLKDFHHISTISVLDTNIKNHEFFTEDSLISIEKQTNYYNRTKYEAEKQVLRYRQDGVNTNIYRIGNLAFILNNLRVQKNIEDNAFLSRMKCLVTLKMIPKEIGIEEISPVDLTAEAIVKLLDKEELNNGIYHVFNPHLCNISEFFSEMATIGFKITSIDKFLDTIASYMHNPSIQNRIIMRFLLHQGWLEAELSDSIIPRILERKTNAVLNKLGFNWPIITKNLFWSFIRKAYLYDIE